MCHHVFCFVASSSLSEKRMYVIIWASVGALVAVLAVVAVAGYAYKRAQGSGSAAAPFEKFHNHPAA